MKHPATILTPRHEPSAYPDLQLKLACLIARRLNRGLFIYLMDPEDAQ
jgi:hypothetical protein